MTEAVFDQREQAARTAEAQLAAAQDGLQRRRGGAGAGGGAAPRADVAARARRGQGPGRRHRQPAHGARRRLRGGRRRADVPHRRQGRGGARRRGGGDAARRHQGSVSAPASRWRASARSPAPCASSRPRWTRRPGSAACASSWATTRACASAPSPAASIVTAVGDRPRRAGVRRPLRPDGPTVQVVRGNRVETRAHQDRACGRRAGRGARGPGRRRPRGRPRRHLPARGRHGAARARPQRGQELNGARGAIHDELEHLRLVDPPAGAVARPVHGADGARLLQLRAASRSRASPTSTCRSCRCASTRPARRRRSWRCRSPRRSRTPSPA